MTEEQIKQNAKDFAINETGGLAYKYFLCEKGFIAGAHSRDKEIEKLKERIQILEEHACDVCINKMRHDKELDQLRNPWISVEDRQPEEDPDNKGYSVEVIGLFSDDSVGKCHCSIEEDIWFIGMFTCNKPIYWMPMPKI